MSKLKMPAVEESARSTRSRHKEVASIPRLPPLCINTMTMVQLREFVPELMKVVIGDMTVRSLVHRPHWWPPDVPLWSNDTSKKEDVLTEAMRKVVRNCYSHLGQEALLSAGKLNEWKTFLASGNTHKRVNGSGGSVSLQYSPEVAKSGKKPFVEIYVCFFCAEEFSSKNEMRQHQANCTQRPEELQGLDTPPPATKRNKKCGKPTLSIPSSPSSPASPTIEHFLKSFNLIPMSKARKLRASARTSSEVDCTQLDFTDPETPKSPTTPKTPKLLISQLSKDDSGHCKRRLSYRVREETSDTESVVSGSSDDTDDQQTPTKNRSLLSIDVSSILGQRLQKHLKSDANISVVANAEAFCKTPVKNQFLEKLRKKENTFPVTYKPRKKTKKRPHFHLYSFTKHQRKSNYKRIKTGLNRKSRLLARSLPLCKVVVGRLSQNSMKYWESKSEGDPSKIRCVFPQSPTFLSENIDKLLGLRKKNKNGKLERSLSLANMVSEDMNAEVLQQKVALYRSLLSDLSSSQISISPNKAPHLPTLYDKDKYLQQRFPSLNHLNSSNNALPVPEPLTPSSTSSSPDSSQQVHKQPFSQPLKIDIPSQYSPTKAGTSQSMSVHSSHGDSLKDLASSPDDSVSIITVSSDEDCFINVLCCAGCRERQKCKCSPLKTSPPSEAIDNIKHSERRANGQFAKKGELETKKAPVVGQTVKNSQASVTQENVHVAPLKKKPLTQSQKMKERMSNLRARKLVKVHSSMSKEKAKAKKLSLTRERIKQQLVEIKAKENKASNSNKSNVERISSDKKAVEHVTVKKMSKAKCEKKDLSSEKKVSKAKNEKESRLKSGKDSMAKGEKIYKAKSEKYSKVKTDKKDLKVKLVEKKEPKASLEKKASNVNFEKKNSKVKSDKNSTLKSEKGSKVKSDKDTKPSGSKKILADEKKKSSKLTPIPLHRQSSAPDGTSTTLVLSQGLPKNPLLSVKPLKHGVRSANSTPTNSPIKKGLKRQASCSPTKSAMPSPKRSKSDLPRRRSNSLAI